MHVDDAVDRREPLLDLAGDTKVVCAVVADGANVDLRWQSEVQDLRDHVGRLEIEDRLGKRDRQFPPQTAHIFRGRCMALLQGDLHGAVVHPDGRSVAEGQIVGPRREADIVDDQVEIMGGDDLADLVLDGLEEPFGRLDAHAGGAADMELKAAGVDHRKKVAADHGEDRAAGADHEDRDQEDGDGAADQLFEQKGVALTQPFKTGVESAVDAGKDAGRLARRGTALAPEKQADRDGRQGPRKAVGRQHGEHHGEAERREQEFGGAVEENDGGEDAADRKRRNQGRDGDTGRPVQGCQRQAHLLLGQEAMGVLDGDRRIVDQDADRQRQPAQGQRVDRLAEEV